MITSVWTMLLCIITKVHFMALPEQKSGYEENKRHPTTLACLPTSEVVSPMSWLRT